MASRTTGFCIAGLALLLVGCGGGRDSSGERWPDVREIRRR